MSWCLTSPTWLVDHFATASWQQHDDVIKWKHFPRHWTFVRGIHRSPGKSPHKGQWRGALMFSLTCDWTNGWVNNKEAGDLRRHRAQYGVTVMAIVSEDIFCEKCPYLCGQAQRAIFGIQQRLRKVPPTVMFKLYEMLIKPVLVDGSDVWGYNKKGLAQIEKVMLHYCRCALNVKASTSNVITVDECGILPPSVYSQISVLCFMNRLHHMSENTVVMQVYNELCKLNLLGFDTWITRVSDLTQHFCLNINMTTTEFRNVCKQTVINNFISTWDADIRDLDKNPIRRFYNKIKHSFGMENYLFGVKNNKYRTALAKLRSSSHTLAIETGRHSRPKLKVNERLCQVCQCIEDETHRMIGSEINTDERSHLFTRVTRVYPVFNPYQT